MTPTIFLEFNGLWLPSTAIARRLHVPMAYGPVYPNLYGAEIAPTTLYRKTTGMALTEDLASRVLSHLLAPQDVTPEAFLTVLAGHQPNRFDDLPEQLQAEWRRGRDFAGQRGLMLDEMSGLMAAAGKEYMAGLVEAFLRFYDCTPRYTRQTRGQGLIVVRNAYLSFLGASTPKAMAPFLADERLWGMGWWPRFALLTPESEHPEWQTPIETPEPPELPAGLSRLHDRLPRPAWPDPPESRPVLLGTEVHERWARYNKALSYDLLVASSGLDQRLWGAYGRLPSQLLKVATILAALDWADGAEFPTIEIPHLARAMAIVERWRASAHRALNLAAQTGYVDLQQRIMRHVARFGEQGATKRDLCRAMRDKEPRILDDVVEQMVAAGDLDEIRCAPAGGGRHTQRYRLSR